LKDRPATAIDPPIAEIYLIMAGCRHVIDTRSAMEVAAMSIRSLVTPGEFDREALATRRLWCCYKALDDAGQPKIMLVIAQRIIEAATRGGVIRAW
jgi:hypothetical protein